MFVEALTHSRAVCKGLEVEIGHLVSFGKSQNRESMRWLLSHVHIAFLIQVGQEVPHVIGSGLAILLESIRQCNESVSQVFADYRSPKGPGKEVADRQVEPVGP